MKFRETSFDEYIQSSRSHNLHPKLLSTYDGLPNDIENVPNLVMYGPSGTGKYTQALVLMERYSPSSMKYEKKMSTQINKQTYNIKLSDIHYEVDFSLLGCNARATWHDIYLQIVDAVGAKTVKAGFILCKNFHAVNGELLDIFYSYMQRNRANVVIKFVFLTEQMSFLPNSVVDGCSVIAVPRPTKTNYGRCSKAKMAGVALADVSNIKCIGDGKTRYGFHCDRILNMIRNVDTLRFVQLRECLYDMLIMDLDIAQCMWYILKQLIANGDIKPEAVSSLLIKTYVVLQRYNNNYRPIMHLESFIFTLTNTVHGYSCSAGDTAVTA